MSICCLSVFVAYITHVLPVIFISLYFYSEITSFYIKYFVLPYSIDVVSTLYRNYEMQLCNLRFQIFQMRSEQSVQIKSNGMPVDTLAYAVTKLSTVMIINWPIFSLCVLKF